MPFDLSIAVALAEAGELSAYAVLDALLTQFTFPEEEFRVKLKSELLKPERALTRTLEEWPEVYPREDPETRLWYAAETILSLLESGAPLFRGDVMSSLEEKIRYADDLISRYLRPALSKSSWWRFFAPHKAEAEEYLKHRSLESVLAYVKPLVSELADFLAEWDKYPGDEIRKLWLLKELPQKTFAKVLFDSRALSELESIIRSVTQYELLTSLEDALRAVIAEGGFVPEELVRNVLDQLAETRGPSLYAGSVRDALSLARAEVKRKKRVKERVVDIDELAHSVTEGVEAEVKKLFDNEFRPLLDRLHTVSVNSVQLASLKGASESILEFVRLYRASLQKVLREEVGRFEKPEVTPEDVRSILDRVMGHIDSWLESFEKQRLGPELKTAFLSLVELDKQALRTELESVWDLSSLKSAADRLTEYFRQSPSLEVVSAQLVRPAADVLRTTLELLEGRIKSIVKRELEKYHVTASDRLEDSLTSIVMRPIEAIAEKELKKVAQVSEPSPEVSKSDIERLKSLLLRTIRDALTSLIIQDRLQNVRDEVQVALQNSFVPEVQRIYEERRKGA